MNTLQLPAKMESIESFRTFILSKTEALDIPAETLSKIELALEELLTNIVSYAYPNGAGSIELDCCSEQSGSIRLRITDWGIPFDPLAIEPPDLTTGLEERQIGGLGIHLVRQMVDGLSYSRKDGKNILQVLFRYGQA